MSDWGGKVILVVVGLGLALLGAEGVCRVARIPYDPKSEASENALAHFDPVLGWSYNANKALGQQAPGQPMVPYFFDENGIRVGAPKLQTDRAKPSVLFIGCSFTFGHAIPYEETFVGQFGALAQDRYQAVNLGVQAYGSDQALLALEKFLPQFNSKVVVYSFLKAHIARNGNYDRQLLLPRMRFIATKPLFELDGAGNPYVAKQPLAYQDYTHSWFLDFLKINVGSRIGLFPSYPVDLTRALIRQMKTFSEQHGAYFMVLEWDWEFHDLATDQERALDTAEVFRDLDVDHVLVSEMAPAGWQQMRTPGSGHPNAQMNDHVAHLLVRHLHDKNLL